ncbi:MAG: hypothetical protein AAGI72_06170 [Pseudomonadota bacterium]
MTKRLSDSITASLLCCALGVLGSVSDSVCAKDRLLAEFDLEPSLESAALVLAVRVDEVLPVRVIHGGKGGQTIQQYRFAPVRVLKGVFTRPELLMTSADLRPYVSTFEPDAIRTGQHRLLILGRSDVGFYGLRRGDTTEQSYPRLIGPDDPMLDAAEGLLAQQETTDRKELVINLGNYLPQARESGAVALLAALEKRSDVAAQHMPTVSALASKLRSNNADVREAAALVLASFFRADYLNEPDSQDTATSELIRVISSEAQRLSPRVAALQALALVPDSLTRYDEVTDLLSLETRSDTNAELAARLDIFGGVNEGQAGAAAASITRLLDELALDAPPAVQRSAANALARVAKADAAALLLQRLRRKQSMGLEATPEIQAMEILFAHVADPWPFQQPLTETGLTRAEQLAFLRAVAINPAPKLVPMLAGLLDPAHLQVRRLAIDVLMEIDNEASALALEPQLAEENNLRYKLRIAEFLGRHGIDSGYEYAVEHMSDARYWQAALRAIAAISKPGAPKQMYAIYQSSNDLKWRKTAVRALGLLRHDPFGDELTELTANLGHPLAASALWARADLGDTKAIDLLPAAMRSRSEALMFASANAAESFFSQELDQGAGPGRDVLGLLTGLATNRENSVHVRGAALDALLAADDPQVDSVLIAMVSDRGLEDTSLIVHVQELLRERRVNVWSNGGVVINAH